MKKLKVLLILVAVVCIGVAVSYPIRYKMELDSNNSDLEDLSGMRRRVLEEQHLGLDAEDGGAPRESEESPEKIGAPEVVTEEPDATRAEPGETEAPAAAETSEPSEEQPEETGISEPSEEQPEETEAPSPTEGSVTREPAESEPATQTGAPDIQETASPEERGDREVSLPEETASVAEAPAEIVTPEDTAVPGDAVRPEDTVAPADTVNPRDTALPSVTGTPGIAETTGTDGTPGVTGTPEATPTPGFMDLLLNDAFISTQTPCPTSTPTPTPSPTPSPTPDRRIRTGPDTFKDKVKVRLDEDKILPELREIYELNHDLVGWLYIEDTNIDYPVVQAEDGKFYLTHDFYGRSNANGQIILEDKCDPYTPSYNLVLSGHHMNSGAMFGRLGKYKDKDYWETHKVVEFDTLMARKRYVIFGAFYSADYDEHEEGFRYSADIQYRLDADMWLDEIRANQIYETGIEAEFGDEFITLTTCDHSRRYDGRFVVVARRIREGENFQ